MDRAKILDVGCFRGDYLRRLDTLVPRRWYEYQGVDINASAIESNRRAFSDWANARFAVADIFNLDYPDQSFDFVICTDVLIHLPELQRPLSEIYRVAADTLHLIVHLTQGMSGDFGYEAPDGSGHFLDMYYNLPDLSAAFEKLDPRPTQISYRRFPKYSADRRIIPNVEYAYFELGR